MKMPCGRCDCCRKLQLIIIASCGVFSIGMWASILISHLLHH